MLREPTLVSDDELPRLRGTIKWFDPVKGFGFIATEDGGPDILLHINALRNFGQSTVAERAGIEVSVQKTPRGLHAVEVFAGFPPAPDQSRTPPELSQVFSPEVLALPLEPARVKWFDRGRGFGFVNVFGRSEDVFVHMEVVRKSGFSELLPGEGVAVRTIQGQRGRMVAMVVAWEAASRCTELK